MRLLFFSDVHGMPSALELLLRQVDRLCPNRIVLLGDILHHGPVFGGSGAFDSGRVAEALNSRKDDIIAVRGNCDSEADQSRLAFPILAEQIETEYDGRHFFFTHGDFWNERRPPKLPAGSILVHGHTHVPESKLLGNGMTVFNPGSIALPRSGFPPTFGLYDDGELTIRDLADGDPIAL